MCINFSSDENINVQIDKILLSVLYKNLSMETFIKYRNGLEINFTNNLTEENKIH